MKANTFLRLSTLYDFRLKEGQFIDKGKRVKIDKRIKHFL